MSEEKLRQVFARNLKRQLEIHGKQPVDLVNDLHIPFSTVSNWINAAKFPRMSSLNQHTTVFYGIFRTSEAHQSALQYSKLPTNCPQKKAEPKPCPCIIPQPYLF